MKQEQIIAKLLHRLAETIGRSSPAEIDALLAGKSSLVVSSALSTAVPGASKLNSPSKKRVQKSTKELAAIAARLRQLVSRAEGTSLLEEAQLSRKEFEYLARLMDLPVLRTDDAERLKQKIVEECIGARLNSQAIRGQ